MSDSSCRTRIEQDSKELYALEARPLPHVPSAQNGKKRVAQDNMLVSISGDTVVAGGWVPLAPLQPAPRRGRRTHQRGGKRPKTAAAGGRRETPSLRRGGTGPGGPPGGADGRSAGAFLVL